MKPIRSLCEKQKLLLVLWRLVATGVAQPTRAAQLAGQSTFTKVVSPQVPATINGQRAQNVARPRAIVLDENMLLGLGSPPPAIKVENWLRGQPLTSFQRGRVYIVEFGQLGADLVRRRCCIWLSYKRNTKTAESRSLDSQLMNMLGQRTRPEAIWTHG